MRKIDIQYLEQVVEQYDVIIRKLRAVLEHSYSEDDVIIVDGIDRHEIRVTELIRDMITSAWIDRLKVRRKAKYFQEFFKDNLV